MTSSQSENVPPHPAHPPHYLHELPLEDEERIGEIFNTLDLDGNGKIDIYDLSAALKEFGVSHYDAQKILEKSDSNKSGDISLAEFIHYVKEHEKNLRLSFSHIDKNKDGKIDQEELTKAFKELGIEIDVKEAKKLLRRMDKDGSLEISFNEWRDFLLYCPYTDIHDLIKYWRHSTYLDIGEDINVPDDFTQTEMLTGMWWRHLVAGGVAGAVSRTCTAPLDRLKVYLQEGGVWSLWRGNGINVLKIAPESALKFMAYEQAKRVIRGSNTRELTIYERFVAGSFAGSFSQTIIYPLEVGKSFKMSSPDQTTEQFEMMYEVIKRKVDENCSQLSRFQANEDIEDTLKLIHERHELNKELSRLNESILHAYLRGQSSVKLHPLPNFLRRSFTDLQNNLEAEIRKKCENSSDADDESDGLSDGSRISGEEQIKLQCRHIPEILPSIPLGQITSEDTDKCEGSDDGDEDRGSTNRDRIGYEKSRWTSSLVPCKQVNDSDRRPRKLGDLEECDETHTAVLSADVHQFKSRSRSVNLKEDTFKDVDTSYSELSLSEDDADQQLRNNKSDRIIPNGHGIYENSTAQNFRKTRSFGDSFLSKFHISQGIPCNTADYRRSRNLQVFYSLLVIFVVLCLPFLYIKAPACQNIVTTIRETIHCVLHWNQEWYQRRWKREVKPLRRKRIRVVLKTRLSLRKTGQYRSIADAAQKILKQEGWRSFYRGYVPNLLGIVPYAGIDLAVYETLKNSYLTRHNEMETPNVFLLLACGTISSTCGQMCSYPLALVRTKLQAQVLTNVGTTQPYTMTRLLKTIIQEEGFTGLYRGITPNFLKVAPAVSISYVVYERCRQALGVRMT